MQVQAADLDSLLAQSAATREFREAVTAFAAGKDSPLVRHKAGAPPVKVLRVISKLLEAEPQLAVREVEVDGVSGCSSFVGVLRVNGGEAAFRFRWDCAWRAEQEGWFDAWGSPDQIRAARTFGYQCFETFERAK